MKVGLGLSKKEDPYLAGREAAEIARKEIHKEKINLAFVFSSVDLASISLLKGIKDVIGEIPLTGCTGSSIISNFKIEESGVLVILVSSKKLVSSSGFFSEVSKKGFREAGEELSIKLLKGFEGISRQFCLIFSDGLLERTSEILWGMQTRLGKSFPLVGGLSSDNLRFQKTFQYFGQNLLSDSIIGILIFKGINYGIATRHGFKPLGRARIVTDVEKNRVKSIDSKPAVNFYEEYFGRDIRSDFGYITRLYPLGIYLEEERDYLLRSVLRKDLDGSLVFQEDISKDSKIKLMIGTKESLLEAVRLASEEVKSVIKKKADLVFIFDSFSRKMILGREAEKEIEIIKNIFGKDTPIAGFYTYGEQAPLKSLEFKGQSYLHNHSITILAIAE